MSYPATNASDKADFYYSSGPACGNCGVQRVPLTWISEGDWMACDACADEQERIEEQSRALAAEPSLCEERAAIVDAALSCRQLVNALKAHEQTACAVCASTRKTVLSDRLYVAPGAVCCEGLVA